MVDILIESGMHLHDCIISQRRDAWVHAINLTNSATFFYLCTKSGKWAVCICVLCLVVSILHISTIFLLDFELLRQCGIFFFSFHFMTISES